jgi:hypothetical protein
MNRKKLRMAFMLIALVLTGAMFTSAFLSTMNGDQVQENILSDLDMGLVADDRVVHDPILIRSDADFVYRDNDGSPSQSLSSGFSLASASDPNITAIYWQNMTEGSDEEWVTWMQPRGDVRIWFEVKGPIEASGPIVTVSFEEVKFCSSIYGLLPLAARNLNGVVELGEDETAWVYWDQTLPENMAGLYYGWGLSFVNAFTLRLYHPPTIPHPVPITYYEGLNHPYSFLNMYGEFDVKEVKWYNRTESDPLEISEISVAQGGWFVSPLYSISVLNAPVWGLNFATHMYADVVWLPDVPLAVSGVQAIGIDEMMCPGVHQICPLVAITGERLFVEIDDTMTYGSGFGQRKGIYCKLFEGFTEIYSSNAQDGLLYVLESRYEQAPQIQVVAPLNGEVFTGSTLGIDAFISDGNSNYDIDTLLLYMDGVETDVLFAYDEVVGRLVTSVDLPQENSIVNITIYAEDETGLSDSATLLIRSDDPNAYFPSEYTPGHEHYSLLFLEQEFVWEQRLTYEPSEIVNITFTPRLTITVTPAIEFDLYYARPSSVSAGDDFATYMMIVDPRISLTIDILLESDCELRFETWRGSSQGVEIFRESWYASRSIGLGVEVLDLRYDLPSVSRYIRSFTHFEVDLLDVIPVISAFADLNLIVDIVPILRVSNILDAIVSGIDCTPQLTEISFVSERMFVIESSVSDTMSGTSCELQLSGLEMSSAVGFDLSVALKLAGAVAGMTIGEVDLNEWMYDHLGISVPSLNLWQPIMTLPLEGTISIVTDVESQQLQSRLVGLSADESNINVTIRVRDEHGNNIPSATVTAAVGAEVCTVNDLGGGYYAVVVSYRNTQFVLTVSYSKTGYLEDSEAFDIYVDPLVVDSTPPSITDLERDIQEPTEEDTVTVTASIVDLLTGVVNPTLLYSINNGLTWNEVSMILVSGSQYKAEIPAQAAGTTVLYYVKTSDGASNQAATDQLSYVTSTTTPTTSTTTTTTTDETTTTDGTTDSGTADGETTDGQPISPVIVGAMIGVVCIIVVIVLAQRRRK